MEEIAAQEAAAAGLQSVEKLIRLLSHSSDADYQAVAANAVTKFKKFISLIDRNRTGHARFRRGPVPNPPPQTPKIEPAMPPSQPPKTEEKEPGSKIYCPTPIQRLPPLPHNHPLIRNGSLDRKEVSTTINFSSPATSFISSLTGDTESLQPSMSSGFQITNLSQVSSAGRPMASTPSFKRKCSSMDDAAVKCGGTPSGSRCHCPKKR